VTDKQVMVENGRVSALQQWMLNISAPIVVAAIIGTFGMVLWLRIVVADLANAVKESNTQQKAQIELLKMSQSYERAELDRRVTALEREWERSRDSDDN
jgi:choline-glycine betaine transporter